ncbi:MAG: hypothetical protein K2O70_07980, partial [Desulfovibrionaceae bacterium]|nr:hypothetical protein [Desulfovibrionaceae bacterium]
MYLPDAILTLSEVCAALRLDPRTVKRIACHLGGRRTGRRWRFRWGTVMEFFNAYETQESGRLLARAGGRQRKTDGQQGVPSGPREGAGVDRRQKLGGATKKGNPGG